MAAATNSGVFCAGVWGGAPYLRFARCVCGWRSGRIAPSYQADFVFALGFFFFSFFSFFSLSLSGGYRG